MEEYELDLFYMFREMQIQQFLQKEIVIVLVIEKLIKVYLQYMYFYYFLYFYIYGDLRFGGLSICEKNLEFNCIIFNIYFVYYCKYE